MSFILIIINLSILYAAIREGLYGTSDYIILTTSLLVLFAAVASIVIA